MSWSSWEETKRPTLRAWLREARLGSGSVGSLEVEGTPWPQTLNPSPFLREVSTSLPPAAWGERGCLCPCVPRPCHLRGWSPGSPLWPQEPQGQNRRLPHSAPHPGWLALKAGPQPGSTVPAREGVVLAVWAASFQKPGPAGRALTAELGNSGAQALWPSVESWSGIAASTASSRQGRWARARADLLQGRQHQGCPCPCNCVHACGCMCMRACVPATHL